jgi:hypothetical protein
VKSRRATLSCCSVTTAFRLTMVAVFVSDAFAFRILTRRLHKASITKNHFLARGIRNAQATRTISGTQHGYWVGSCSGRFKIVLRTSLITNTANIRLAQYRSPLTSRKEIGKSRLSALPNGRSRSLITRGDGIVRPDQSWIVRLICTWECDERAGGATASTRNFNLRTRKIHLCASDRLCLVQRNAFDADEVFAAWNILGNLEIHDGFLCEHLLTLGVKEK